MEEHTGYQGCIFVKEEHLAKTTTILCEYFAVGLIYNTFQPNYIILFIILTVSNSTYDTSTQPRYLKLYRLRGHPQIVNFYKIIQSV